MEIEHKAFDIELTIKNGVVTSVRQIQKGEIIASLDTFFGQQSKRDTKLFHLMTLTQKRQNLMKQNNKSLNF